MKNKMAIGRTLESLPSELLSHILAFLTPTDLARLSAISQCLRSHAHNDLLWEVFVRQNVPFLTSPTPAKNWRELYTCHHPYWFLVRHKIWHSDNQFSGEVVLFHFDTTTGAILGNKILARNPPPTAQQWLHNPSVMIIHFRPEVHLWTAEPVVKLEYEEGIRCNRLQKEIELPRGLHGARTSLSLCSYLPPESVHPSMALWPPLTIPSPSRVRNESPTKFRLKGQRPKSLSAVSDRAFRIRKWTELSSARSALGSAMDGLNVGEYVCTWATLLPESYKPTKRKPWQGIWVGDYSSHGCEILLVMQKARPSRNPRNYTRAPETDSGLPAGFLFTDESGVNLSDESAVDDAPESATHTGDTNKEDAPSGSMTAIKLTGDINVPRGECTWFADDISDAALIRHAEEETFQGARIVRGYGHVADRGFQDDRFIPSQLILRDHNNIAQYWESFGHISCYKRIDIDALLKQSIDHSYQSR